MIARILGIILPVFAVVIAGYIYARIADRYHQEPAKVAAIVLIGNMGSVLFVPVGLSIALNHF